MSTHTPGEWMPTVGFDKVIHTRGAKLVTVCSLFEPRSDAVREADCRLIAAAPTMYSYINGRAVEGDADAAAILEAINARS